MTLDLKKTRAGKSYDYRGVTVFRKVPLSKCFPSTLKLKAGVFKFLLFEERFRKTPFSWRISVHDRSICRNKAAFLNFSGGVWMGPKSGLSFDVAEVGFRNNY